jgi:non-homologous end joining protein Ku
MRAVSRTTLELGELLQIPVGIAAATGPQDVKFDTAFPDGTPRKQQYVHSERTHTLYGIPEGRTADELGELLATDLMPVEVPEVIAETVKGVRVGDDFYVVPPSEIAYAHAATQLDAIELLEFVNYQRVPTDRLTGTFYVQPDPGFARPLRTILRAMRAEGSAMLVKWTSKSRQRLGVIRVREHDGEDILVLNGIVFAAEMRAPDEQVLEPARVEAVDRNAEEAAVAAARQIIRAHHGTGKALDTARDDLPALLTEVVERAHAGVFDDPARVLDLAATFCGELLDERADQLVEWAEQRWPVLAEQREEVQRVIAAGGDDVGEKLAAIVG